MKVEIEKAGEMGFCFGVRRAIKLVERAAREFGRVETLGPLVHNRQVLNRLEGSGVRVAESLDDISGRVVVISTHGADSDLEGALQARQLTVINTTCPFVRRAHMVSRRLAESGYFVVVYGDAGHTEVRGVLGWAGGHGVATMDEGVITAMERLPRRLGVLSQTTQIPARFNNFVKKLVDVAFTADSELRVIDTICHDIRRRQVAAAELAGRVDVMLVVGGHNSANSNRLAELCYRLTPTHLVETAAEIEAEWFHGRGRVGITSGTSTGDEAMSEVISRLEELSSRGESADNQRERI